MKATPTLEGGIRIDAEDADDWKILRAILVDAEPDGDDLASRLGGLVGADAGGEDWRDYVVPDLREAFQDELAEVAAAIEAAMVEAGGGAGPVWIAPDQAFAWYSALNQARLALEELHHFGQEESLRPKHFEGERRNAFIRSRFYCAIQTLLLDYVMK